MIWYDFVVLGILIFTAWSGAQRGLVTQLAWIVALVLCFKFADKLAPVIEPQINVEQPLRHWIAMFVLYIAFSLGSFMGAKILESWMEKAKLKDFDRHLGGIFGMLKGVIIALVATFFAVTLSDSLKNTVLQSKTGYAACVIIDNIEPITPEYFHEYLAKYRDELSPLQNSHESLGSGSSTMPDLWGDGSVTESEGQGGLNLPNLWNELAGDSKEKTSGSDDFSRFSGDPNEPSLDEMMRNLPAQMRDQFGDQIRDQWNSASPEQKRNFVSDLGRSIGYEVPNVVSEFLTKVNPLNDPNRGGEGTTFRQLMADISNEYGRQGRDPATIVRRTQEYFAGVPSQVQEAVIRDWHADLTYDANDPDPLTDELTALDVRILRQLDRAGVSWNRLSFELRQRLNLSRQ